MKKAFCLTVLLFLSANLASFADVETLINTGSAVGIFTDIMRTKSTVERNDAYIKKLNAETEDIKKNGSSIKVIRQPDGTAKVYQNGVEVKSNADPNSPEYQMGLKMAESIANRMERNDAKNKLKTIKSVAKIENDTQTLEIIEKYKKAGPVVTVQKIEEMKKVKK